MSDKKGFEIKIIYGLVILVFLIFLIGPILCLLLQSVQEGGSLTLEHYRQVLGGRGFLRAFGNSIVISFTSALCATALAFLLACAIHYTNLGQKKKAMIRRLAVLPMLLPTITYGFAIIYSFGKQGLLTRLLGRQPFDIYGFQGLLIGYVIYTLPVAFLLVSNTMEYIDKKFMVVSRIMGDGGLSMFFGTILRPLWGTLAASMVQCFFLCFTDYGIPASVGGEYEVTATVLYNQMLGSVPNFGRGAAVAMFMLIPSVLTIALLHYLEKYNVRYHKISSIELRKNKVRDGLLGGASALVLAAVLSVFLVIFIAPFIDEWPYRMSFTLEHVRSILQDKSLWKVYKNAVMTALLTALGGSVITYGAALTTARSTLGSKWKQGIESISLVTNTIPGMVIGIAYLLVFSGTSLQNTFFLIVICNVIHFFSTPYLMIKNSLSKMNASWETTAMLMGDTWLKTIVRVVTPNAAGTILEVFSYYFVNAMVTVSAVIFIAGARTMVITTKIKELQYFNKYNEIFVLSLGILFTNLLARALFQKLAAIQKREKQQVKKGMNFGKRGKKWMAAGLCLMMTASMLTACGKKEEEVVIYTNADDEAVEAMKHALDGNGYEGKYLLQSFGTSELGGKLLAEGSNLEADLVTMSSFYLDSAQEKNQMFRPLTFAVNTLEEYPDFYAPITAQEGAIIVNTQLMEENQLPMPASLKDLTDPAFQNLVSVTDIQSSSTAWLLIQALVSEYGEEGAEEVLHGIYENAGPHIESSGSAPLKKVRAGEVAVGFGLRHQAVADKADGLPVDFVDPAEGNFSLTESVAVVEKGEDTNELAMEMAQCIIENGREELLQTYPVPLYEGEEADEANQSANPRVFPEKLTVELLEKHQAISESAK